MQKAILCLSIMAVLFNVNGCNPSNSTPREPANANRDDDGQTPGESDVKEHGHDHAHAPHGGTLFDWGGGAYHLEFTVDHDRQEATIYILGGDAQSPAPIRASEMELLIADPSTEIELSPQPLEGETDGLSSRFVGKHATIGIVKEFSGTVRGVVEGTPYSGDFKEQPHGHDH